MQWVDAGMRLSWYGLRKNNIFSLEDMKLCGSVIQSSSYRRYIRLIECGFGMWCFSH